MICVQLYTIIHVLTNTYFYIYIKTNILDCIHFCYLLYVFAHANVEVKEQHMGIGFLLPLCGSISISGSWTLEISLHWVKEPFKKWKRV